MNYAELTALALKYSDRSDQETLDEVDKFLRIVEGRINKKIMTLKMTSRATVPIVQDQEYYGLPNDFKGVRDIQRNDINGDVVETLKLATPESINNLRKTPDGNFFNAQTWYTIIADQLQIKPPRDDGSIEIVYYQRIPPITALNDTNWIGDNHPDLYEFGLTTEISMFAKDYEAAQIWDGRFKESLLDLKQEDSDIRWSGTPMQIRANN